MATLRGEQGAVQFETGSGSLATVVGTRSWSLTITKETLETTAHGDTFRNVHWQFDFWFWHGRVGLRP